MAIEWSSDVEEASWWLDALHPWSDVGAIIADSFAAYARVFHPVREASGARSWSDVAREHGRVVHPEMQFHAISRAPDAPRARGGYQDHRLRWGSLPHSALRALAETLAVFTPTPLLRWCVWEGFAQLHSIGTAHPARIEKHAPWGRNYLPGTSKLDEIDELYNRLGRQSPNVWWPADQSWCVATEIDFAWTYVGGSVETIAAVLADPRLEALPATPSDGVQFNSDRINNDAL